MKHPISSLKRLVIITINFSLMAFFVFQALFTFPVQAGALSDEVTPTPEAPAATGSAEEYNWLSFPPGPDALASDRSLAILAGKLIFHGLVDPGSCPNNGLMKNGAANPCGEIVARKAVIIWQNQFDAAILDASNQSGVPPFLLKNVLSQESQFWPSNRPTVYGYSEVGLGHVTEMGADTLLRWSPAYESGLCPAVFSADTCKKPFAFMPANQQAALRGMVMQQLDADCSDCRGGLNLQTARRSINTIAAVLRANYTHAQWVSSNLARSSGSGPSQNMLWRFALAGYNAGPGCLTTALVRARNLSRNATWKEISSQFDPACHSTVDYIELVTNVHSADQQALLDAAGDDSRATLLVNYYLQMDYPGLFATPTNIATVTPDVTATPVPSQTPEFTPTILPSQSGTPAAASETPTATPPDISAGGTATPAEATLTLDASQAAELSATPGTETATPQTGTEPQTATVTPTANIEPGLTATAAPTSDATAVPTAVMNDVPNTSDKTQFLVKFSSLVPSVVSDFVLKNTGARIESQVRQLGLAVISVPTDQASKVLDALKNNLLVEYAEPNYTLEAMYTPDDPGFAGQTHYADMQIPQAWDVTQGENVLVAVIDTGADLSHPELAPNLWLNAGETGTDASGNDKRSNGLDDDGDGYIDNAQGWNFLTGSSDVADLHGHGTHVAGLIAARMDNAQGIAGVAPSARLMILKALDDTGRGSYSQVAEAIVYAVDHGARVINLGLGGDANSETLLAATNYAYNHNVTVIAAAGNNAGSAGLYPAANPQVIAVAALDLSLGQAPFASYGPSIQLAAPGVGLESTLPGGEYGRMSGSSMSAAQVAGIAALLSSQPQFDTPDKIRAALVNTARDLGEPGRDNDFGYGLPRAYDALSYTPSGLVTPTPRSTPTATPDGASLNSGVTVLAADAANANIANYTIPAASCTAGTYTTQLTGTNIAITGNDVVTTTPMNIGFDFWYMGTRYTQFYASSNGWISLSSPSVATNFFATNGLDTVGGAARPIIAPLWDDLAGAGTGGAARYSTTGTAPNRVLTIEWWNWLWSTTTTGNVSFRIMLFENTGAIRFMYKTDTGVAPTTGSASIGLTGFNSGVFRSIQSIPAAAAACPGFAAPEVTTLATRPVNAQQWDFTPPTPAFTAPATSAVPNALSMNAVTDTSLNLTWQDNANNENGYVIYNSTNGTTWTFVGQTAANATSYAASGLTAGTTYYWRVYAVTEGALTAAPVLTAPTTLSFSSVQFTSMTLNWADTSANETGFLIYNSSDGLNYSLVAQAPANASAAASYNVTGLAYSTNYFWRVMAVTPGAISAAAAGTQATALASTQLPVVSIITPITGSSASQNNTIMFMGSAIIPTNGDISSSLVWTSSLDGAIGTGASFSISSLRAGIHTITASVTDIYGRVAQSSITLNVLTFANPHTSYSQTTEKCAICHLPHTSQTSPILDFNQSPLISNGFCMKCHASATDGVPAVSTHSNIDWPGNSASRSEPAQFELLCVQCHDPHGSTNLSAIRRPDNGATTADDAYSGLRITLSPLLKANVTFTSKTGVDSFDEVDGAAPADGGAAANADDLCVTCHSNPANPGYPMVRHDGGYHTSSPYLTTNPVDTRGQDCTSCHPHSLDASASTRDGFMTGCRACHSQAQNNGDNVPPGGRRQIVGSTGGGDFTRTAHHVTGSDAVTDADCLVCHEMTQHKAGSVRLFNADNPATVYTLSPVINTTDDPTDFENFCISCHDSNGRAGITTPFSDKKIVPALNSLWASARHNVLVSTFKGSCIDCHDSGHGSNKAKLLAPWNAVAQPAPDAMRQEERFCFGCHGAAGPGRPIETSFSLYTNTATSIFKHDVSTDNGLNHGKEIFGSSFANRHVECGDCHESHTDAYPNTATAPAIKLSQRGATGVAPLWPAAGGAPTGFTFLAQAVNEYEVCFKCHSSYTTLPGYAPTGLGKLNSVLATQLSESRDLAREFNPATSNPNASFHPVTAVGKNTTIAAGTFVAGWSAASRTYCSDCHTNAASTAAGNAGPHGSPRLHILAGTVDYITVDNNDTNPVHNPGELCFKCHLYSVYVNGTTGSSFSRHQLHNFASCYDCHDTHGSDNKHLVNFNTAHVTFPAGRNSQTAYVPGAVSGGSCYLSCHGQGHNPETYP